MYTKEILEQLKSLFEAHHKAAERRKKYPHHYTDAELMSAIYFAKWLPYVVVMLLASLICNLIALAVWLK